MFEYIRDGKEIYKLSFQTIRQEADLSTVPHDLEKLVVRIIHACGMPSITDAIDFSPNAGAIGRQALQQGAPILCDSMMVANGITRSRLPADNQVICTLQNKDVANHATQINNTRSAAAIDFWGEQVDGAIVAIGNAPTALFYLLEKMATTQIKPALVLGFPVGFVGAAESKKALSQNKADIAFVTLHGRLGGSAMAAAAVNALASEVE